MSDKLANFLAQFTFPHEVVHEKGHHGDLDHVTWENVSGDTGGVTKWGVDQASHPGVNIKALTQKQAVEIYRTDYWNRCRCEDLKEPLCYVVFDIAVNNGVGRAAKWLQEAAGVTADGHIGPITLAAANDRPDLLALVLLKRRENFYRQIAKQPSKAKFLKGWLARNRDLGKIAMAA